ncbi:amidase 1 isoform X2 [Ananas comosus]|uniref:Amidase 1 isoform X2 n=1 Tax=Ananas comosus TaxID=4615 RepID=A0A6P5ELZ3_ANACO|nr:amidase 1 isoform X2 [Ananas comosus]
MIVGRTGIPLLIRFTAELWLHQSKSPLCRISTLFADLISTAMSLGSAILIGRGRMQQLLRHLLLFLQFWQRVLFVLVKLSWMKWPTAFMHSINGENKHYGTPTNPCAPDRVPGGSSSGSAVAVAAKLVDFSLGTDTGGSVRVPAAYCGIFGFRPSHGIISTMNVIPMAQIFDTVGWFARDLTTLTQVGRVLLPLPIEATKKASRIVIPTDGFELLCSSSDKTYHILNASVEKIFGCDIIDNENLGEYISKNVPSIGNFISSVLENQACKIPALAALSHSMRLLQRFEFKANHGEWIYAVRPNLGPGIQERVSEVLTTKYENMECCYGIRAELQACLTGLLGDSGVLAIPTVPGPPPKLSMEAAALEDFRARAFCLLSIAGMSGFCQISIPLGMHNNLPVSVSLLAKQGADHFLLSIATELYAALKEQASMVWESDNSTA